MRFYLTLAFVALVYLMASGQTIEFDDITGKYQAQSIIQMDTLKKDLLFTKAKEWITLNYKSANDVIQLADKESSKIIVKGNFKTFMAMKEGRLGHTLVLDFKDGRIRYTYSDFSYYSSGSGEIAFESKSLGFKKKIFN